MRARIISRFTSSTCRGCIKKKLREINTLPTRTTERQVCSTCVTLSGVLPNAATAARKLTLRHAVYTLESHARVCGFTLSEAPPLNPICVYWLATLPLSLSLRDEIYRPRGCRLGRHTVATCSAYTRVFKREAIRGFSHRAASTSRRAALFQAF